MTSTAWACVSALMRTNSTGGKKTRRFVSPIYRVARSPVRLVQDEEHIGIAAISSSAPRHLSAVVRRVEQSPNYPLFLMIDLFEIGPRSTTNVAYPKTARIHHVRGWDMTSDAR